MSNSLYLSREVLTTWFSSSITNSTSEGNVLSTSARSYAGRKEREGRVVDQDGSTYVHQLIPQARAEQYTSPAYLTRTLVFGQLTAYTTRLHVPA